MKAFFTVLALAVLCGCRRQPAPDAALTTKIQTLEIEQAAMKLDVMVLENKQAEMQSTITNLNLLVNAQIQGTTQIVHVVNGVIDEVEKLKRK